MKPYEFIENYQNVLSRFGRWPSFHDGEVHGILLDRMRLSSDDRYIPSIEIHLRGWIMAADGVDTGSFKQEHDSVVHFRFDDVFDVALDGFNHQNVLSSLNLSMRTESKESVNVLHVELEHCFGLSGSFCARKAAVLGVVPFVRRHDI